MSRRAAALATLALLAASALWLAPDALGAGNDVGRNIGSTLRHYAAQIYGGVIAIFGLYFLVNRKFTDLAVYFLAAILVGWLVFSTGQVAEAARAIGDRILP